MPTGMGFTSMTAALIGRESAVGMLLGSLLLGALSGGAVNLSISTDTPAEMVLVVRGFTALAVLIMTDSAPILSMLACFMFGLSDAVVLQLAGTGYNAQLLEALPYVVALVVVIVPLAIKRIGKSVNRRAAERKIITRNS